MPTLPALSPTTPLTLIGLLLTLRLLARFASFLLLHLRPSRLPRYLHSTSTKGPAWALVTGASDGIGKHLATQLAAAGFNVVLHGRNPTKLAKVEASLHAEFPGRATRILVADASALPCAQCGPPSNGVDCANTTTGVTTRSRQAQSQPQQQQPALVDFAAIAASLADINLTVLINNAGGIPYPPVYQALDETPFTKLAALTNLNALFPLSLTSALLPQLRANAPALVINISSMADRGMPLLTAYGPAKAHVGAATMALAREMQLLTREGKKAGEVEVMCVRVGEVCGSVYNKASPSVWMPHASTMAAAVLGRVGCGRVVVSAWWAHGVQDWLLGWLPGWVSEEVTLSETRKRWVADQALLSEEKKKE